MPKETPNVSDKQYIKNAKRIYERPDKITFEIQPLILRRPAGHGAWVTALVWVSDEWIQDKT